MRSDHGALASKSALSAAARGRQLPSWEITWEFVRTLEVGVLGRDIEEARRTWRARWEQARDRLAGFEENAAPVPTPDATPVEPRTRDERPGLVVDAAVLDEPRESRPRGWWLVAAAATVAVLGVTGVLGVHYLRTGASDESQAPAPKPVIEGDGSEFVRDVTIPDGTEIPTGAHFVKTWEIRNSGNVPWIDRYLIREGDFGRPGPCESVDRVRIPDTRPGETVQVSVEVRAPDEPGHCQVYWKMADAHGRLLLPGHRGIFYLVKIVR
ncbi:hypothetical protein GCM10012275_25760 [Longimycelium tulufanense]|uniref:Nbr1 FW domain-containing protein n=1 Tax=Longimycelium tulufanense TaxID=907463 RepID=A0A8J3FVR9_9PSEU|nr:NBR1-Ig-like domain-containing protein [Longimycelium tulufanense]GGM53558.1 hypothetical protein GCM10012275_25760 [Longimycelium tulufanense]